MAPNSNKQEGGAPVPLLMLREGGDALVIVLSDMWWERGGKVCHRMMGDSLLNFHIYFQKGDIINV